jgi:hypothetical protein
MNYSIHVVCISNFSHTCMQVGQTQHYLTAMLFIALRNAVRYTTCHGIWLFGRAKEALLHTILVQARHAGSTCFGRKIGHGNINPSARRVGARSVASSKLLGSDGSLEEGKPRQPSRATRRSRPPEDDLISLTLKMVASSPMISSRTFTVRSIRLLQARSTPAFSTAPGTASGIRLSHDRAKRGNRADSSQGHAGDVTIDGERDVWLRATE